MRADRTPQRSEWSTRFITCLQRATPQAAVDEPLLYESWGKNQTYILALSPTEVVDVTETYTRYERKGYRLTRGARQGCAIGRTEWASPIFEMFFFFVTTAFAMDTYHAAFPCVSVLLASTNAVCKQKILVKDMIWDPFRGCACVFSENLSH